jgi:hypothetical protein
MATHKSTLGKLIDAVYGGWARPADDPGVLRAIADYLDNIDNVAEGLLREAGSDHVVERTMQADLRRIADERT